MTTTNQGTPVLAACDIRKSYGKGTARFDGLAGVSLSLHAGESIAIVGKSGSCKSTLMLLLALLDQPDDGTLNRELGHLQFTTDDARTKQRHLYPGH
ncbi:ATP-binding cassette domain-containing protein [Paeniglutamicibacter gangotriensis]|uniref:ATP-binding cassette domain-containing protein n=1 Tax=Paeniglutamicibacter gangotriensis TaxID=254787 RepID=UPI0037C7F360